MFRLVSKFKPTGDQPKAIAGLVRNLKTGAKHQVLLGVTGSGKTFSIANVIEKIQRPALIIEPNKTLAAQIYQELKEFFPNSGVHYFVSYYDYYQPEAYIPQTDTYIEKDAKINEVLDRLRHEAVQDVLSRRDVIVVASVSCIYNIGSPEEYQRVSLEILQGQKITRRELLSWLAALQYQRNDIEFTPGAFRARGNTVELFSATGREVVRLTLEENKVKNIFLAESPLRAALRYTKEAERYTVFPAKFWITPEEKLKIAIANIQTELQDRLRELKRKKMLVEAERLKRRTHYDLEMMEETGYCHGIENYSRHLEFRASGEPPCALLHYFPKDFVVFIDESHLTIPQLTAMSAQDRIRKQTLIRYGFRLPSAIDNRPLTFKEFEEKTPQTIYVSATPGPLEKKRSGKKYTAEQLIRPTGLLEPQLEIRSTKKQVRDLISEIKSRIVKKQRALVITITKRLAEELADLLAAEHISAQWLHSEIKTLERPAILKNLREGKYDVLVGVNLLREGLDLPEVSLVAILDADKEGFLRNETTLIQTMGRAARHQEGTVILYADKMTSSIKTALKEIQRRRKIQEEYNKKYRITPRPIQKEIRAWPFGEKKEEALIEFSAVQDVAILKKEMQEAARNWDFERAAQIRDLIQRIELHSG